MIETKMNTLQDRQRDPRPGYECWTVRGSILTLSAIDLLVASLASNAVLCSHNHLLLFAMRTTLSKPSGCKCMKLCSYLTYTDTNALEDRQTHPLSCIECPLTFLQNDRHNFNQALRLTRKSTSICNKIQMTTDLLLRAFLNTQYRKRVTELSTAYWFLFLRQVFSSSSLLP